MNEYDKQALDFLRDSGAKMTITFKQVVEGFPNDPRDHYSRKEYTVRIDRAGKSYSFPFYDSQVNFWLNKLPTQYDILACVEKYEPYGDVWDFADEYGYNIDCRAEYQRVERIYKACKTQYRTLLWLFGEFWMERLQEIA